MKLCWITDIHLNFLMLEDRLFFYSSISKESPDAVIISGDIAESPNVEKYLTEMGEALKIPIYFVLGNHDFYRGSVEETRAAMVSLTKNNPLLSWIGTTDLKNYNPVLKEGVVVIGKDCFADGRYGNYKKSTVMLNDHRYIKEFLSEFSEFPRTYEAEFYSHRLKKMQELADRDAKDLHQNIEEAITLYNPKKMIILVHVPPFEEACLFRGQKTDDSHLPFFSSKVTGQILLKSAKKNKNVDFLVLCGHTHDAAIFQPLENLTVKVGKAEYRYPEIQEIIEI